MSSSPVAPLNADQTAAAEARATHEGYLHRALVAADVFINEVTGGQMDQTISSRAAIAAQHGSEVGIALSKFLNVFQKNHGPQAAAGDAARAETELQSENTGIITDPEL